MPLTGAGQDVGDESHCSEQQQRTRAMGIVFEDAIPVSYCSRGHMVRDQTAQKQGVLAGVAAGMKGMCPIPFVAY